MDSFCKYIFPLINMYKPILVGVYRGAHRPPSLPEMTYAFLIQLVFCKIWRYIWYVFSAVHIKLLGTLSNDDDDDDNNNVKKKIGFTRKTTVLHVHHAFLYISLTSTARQHDYAVKPPNATFCGGRGHTNTHFPFSIWTWTNPLRIQHQEKSPTFE